MKQMHFSAWLMILMGFLATARSGKADDGTFSYFGRPDLDFWGLEKSTPPQGASAPSSSLKEKESFPWKKYLDPKNKEFFREGDYTPPEPFMEIVRNPSDENLKLWFQYIEKKNELSAKLQARMVEYLKSTRGMALPVEAQTDLAQRVQKIARQEKPALESRRYRFRMYFDSTCPHCRKMFETLSGLASMGFFVEARQIDAGSLSGLKVSVPVERATAGEVKAREISSVPLLLVGDLERKVVFKMAGYKSVNEVLDAIRTQSSSGAPP